jgi:hypothetical protein
MVYENKDIYIYIYNERYFQTAIHFGLINMNHINDFCQISWKTKNYNTVRMVPNSQIKIVDRGAQSIPLTHIYITVHSPGLIQRH